MLSLPSPLENYKAAIVGGAVIVAIAFSSLFLGENDLRELWDLRTKQGELEEHIFELQAGNARMRERIARLRTDPRAIERLARERLGLVRPGEIVYISEHERTLAPYP